MPLVAAFACTSKSATKDQAKERPADKTPITASKAVAEAKRIPFTKDRVSAVVDEWLRAQNAGDMTAYANTYAKRFTGIKLVGNRTKMFDREHWLAEGEYGEEAPDASPEEKAERESRRVEFEKEWKVKADAAMAEAAFEDERGLRLAVTTSGTCKGPLASLGKAPPRWERLLTQCSSDVQ